jgi:hypothetical protein
LAPDFVLGLGRVRRPTELAVAGGQGARAWVDHAAFFRGMMEKMVRIHPKTSRLLFCVAALSAGTACSEDAVLRRLPEPTIQVDELKQKPAAQVDILWVIDSSGSMGPAQANLSNNFNKFITTLTGFVPARFEGSVRRRPMRERPLKIVYRGRRLPYWYGTLGREKLIIGRRMRAICDARGISCDIEWEDRQRIYGDDWYRFLESGKATLGTESGANIFDDDGSLRRTIVEELRLRPDLTFEEVFETHLRGREGRVMMNQISPKVFEAIALGTALILFEGEYSGIVRPWEHFIPLKKDFSNVDQVLAKLDDDVFLEEMTQRAYDEVIAPKKYGYRAAIHEVDALIARKAQRRRRLDPFAIVLVNHRRRVQRECNLATT